MTVTSAAAAPVTTAAAPAATAAPVIIRLSGDLDIGARPLIRRALSAAQGGARAHIIVDLADVTFLDAAGFGVLVAARGYAIMAGGSLTVRSPSYAARRIMDLFPRDLPVAG